MQLKNESLLDLVRDLPYVAGREIASLGFVALADPGRLKTLGGLAQRVPGALAKRQRAARTSADGAVAGAGSGPPVSR
jgi:hypothetical protein